MRRCQYRRQRGHCGEPPAGSTAETGMRPTRQPSSRAGRVRRWFAWTAPRLPRSSAARNAGRTDRDAFRRLILRARLQQHRHMWRLSPVSDGERGHHRNEGPRMTATSTGFSMANTRSVGVMHGFTDSPAEIVAAERSRVALGVGVCACSIDSGQTAYGRWRAASTRNSPRRFRSNSATLTSLLR